MPVGRLRNRLGSLVRRANPASDRTVAIACQGGGSHAAFTAGALGHLLEHLPDGPRVVGLSGTSGDAVVFEDGEVDADAVMASAAVPYLFEAVEIDGAFHWDGFLSQNPPVTDLVLDEHAPAVDELWVIRLTPRATDELPIESDDIYDRTQDLVESMSLERQLEVVERKNRWVAQGRLTGRSFTHTEVRSMTLYDEQRQESRLNRRSSFFEDLLADGEAEARGFLTEYDAA